MDIIFDNWKKTLDDFQSSVEKELEEIRQHQAKVQQIKAEIFDELNSGRYIRDEQHIVIINIEEALDTPQPDQQEQMLLHIQLLPNTITFVGKENNLIFNV